MRTFSNIFAPEVNPFHKVDLSVASHITITTADITAGGFKAGAILGTAGATSTDPILGAVTDGVTVYPNTHTAGADITGLLAHDVELNSLDHVNGDKIPVGVVIKGTVYQDVLTTNNGGAFHASVDTQLETLFNVYAVDTGL